MRVSVREAVGRIAVACVLVVAGSPVVASAATASTSEDPPERPQAGRVVAIPPFAVEGKLPPAVRETIQDDLVAAVERAGFAVVSPKAVQRAHAATPCDGPGCIAELGAKTEATHVLQVWIEQDGRDYLVRTVLSDVAKGSDVATFSQSCDICGVVELGELIVGQSASLRDKLAVTPATIVVSSTPAGALVRFDGGVVGTTPLRQLVSPGTHVVEIEKIGFHAMRRELSLVEGDEETVTFELVAMDAAEVVPEQKRDLTKPLGWATFGVGLGLVGGAVPLLVLNERPVKNRCEGENIDINGLCRYRYKTLVPGAVLAGIGGAMVITGIALVAVHAKRKGGRQDKRTRVSIGPTEIGLLVAF